MPNTVVVGAQWGDEGKGKIIDILSKSADYVVRYQGGNNAGHTVVNRHGQFVLHLVPSGAFHPKTRCVIGNGVVVDPEALLGEIRSLQAKGISVKGRLFVSERAHLIFPFHKIIDRLREAKKGVVKIGTTGRGIGPCYSDKAQRTGIRVVDLLNPPYFRKKLEETLLEKNEIFRRIYRHKGFSAAELCSQYLRFGKAIRPYVADTTTLLNEAIRKKRSILFEGAQGTHLDIDHGTYPFVTSSCATSGGATVGSGVPPTAIDRVIGVVKAYTTRVGEGPFPTEFGPDLMDRMRKKGNEFGATTGRPRRCGWFDAVLARYSCVVNGISEIAVTKLDVLDELDAIKICVGYRHKGRVYRQFPASLEVLGNARPVYETYAGWKKDTTHIRSYPKLPSQAKKYLQRFCALLGAPITLLSVGSHEDQTLAF